MRGRSALPDTPSFRNAIVKLLGHVLGSTLLFLALATASWSLSWMLAFLHAAHPFDVSALELLQDVEIWILYIDVALSGIVLLVGAVRFFKDITGSEMQSLWESFCEGFFGAFRLAGSLVMAPIAVARAFVNGELDRTRRRGTDSSRR